MPLAFETMEAMSLFITLAQRGSAIPCFLSPGCSMPHQRPVDVYATCTHHTHRNRSGAGMGLDVLAIANVLLLLGHVLLTWPWEEHGNQCLLESGEGRWEARGGRRPVLTGSVL